MIKFLMIPAFLLMVGCGKPNTVLPPGAPPTRAYTNKVYSLGTNSGVTVVKTLTKDADATVPQTISIAGNSPTSHNSTVTFGTVTCTYHADVGDTIYIIQSCTSGATNGSVIVLLTGDTITLYTGINNSITLNVNVKEYL